MRWFVLMLSILPAGCAACEDIACAHPLSISVGFPDPSPDEPVSMLVEYDGERRFVSCPSAEAACEVSCGDQACEPGERDVVVSRSSGLLELELGHMSEGRDGESSCRGAEVVTLEVSRGRASFEVVELGVDYTQDEAYGGPGCGFADQPQSRTVSLALQ